MDESSFVVDIIRMDRYVKVRGRHYNNHDYSVRGRENVIDLF